AGISARSKTRTRHSNLHRISARNALLGILTMASQEQLPVTMALTISSRNGLAAFFTRRSAAGAWTTLRIWPLPASCAGTWLSATPYVSCTPITPRQDHRQGKNQQLPAFCAGATRSVNDERASRLVCVARRTLTWCAAAAAKPLSPAILGSPIGAATRSLPCADFV